MTKNSIAFLYQIGTKLRNIFYRNELSVQLKADTNGCFIFFFDILNTWCYAAKCNNRRNM